MRRDSLAGLILEPRTEHGGLCLADLRVGQEAVVVAITDPGLRVSLLRMGLMEGDRVRLTEQAPMGGPMAFRVLGGKVAMRRTDAALVQIKMPA